jgi:hypothetical protein
LVDKKVTVIIEIAAVSLGQSSNVDKKRKIISPFSEILSGLLWPKSHERNDIMPITI